MENSDISRQTARLRNIQVHENSGGSIIKFPKLDEFTVGRWPKADIFLTKNDNMISRQHATFKFNSDSHIWLIKDDNSVNGIFVNGKKLQPTIEKMLINGDCLQFGVAPSPSVPSKYVYEFQLGRSEDISVDCSNKKRRVEIINGNVQCSSNDNNTEGDFKAMKGMNSNSVKTMEMEKDVSKSPTQVCEQALLLAKQKVLEDLQTELQAKLEAKDQEFKEELRKEKARMEELITEKESRQESLMSELSSLKMEYENQRTNALHEKEVALTNITDLLESELQCIICSELFIKTVSLSCAHSFCETCIDEWVKVKKRQECPICRGIYTSRTRSLVLDNYIDRMVEHLSDDLKMQRSALVESRKRQVELHKLKQSAPKVAQRNMNNNNSPITIPDSPNPPGNFRAPHTAARGGVRSRAMGQQNPDVRTAGNWNLQRNTTQLPPYQNHTLPDLFPSNRRGRNRHRRQPRSENTRNNEPLGAQPSDSVNARTTYVHSRTTLLGRGTETAIIVGDNRHRNDNVASGGSMCAPIVIAENGSSSSGSGRN